MCIAMFKGEKNRCFYRILNGLIEDMLYGRVLGFNALARLLTGYAIGFGKNIFKGPVLITMGIVLIGSLFHSIIFVLLGYILKQTSNPCIFYADNCSFGLFKHDNFSFYILPCFKIGEFL